jgi:O-acetylserine/cysteine efflux transporter
VDRDGAEDLSVMPIRASLLATLVGVIWGFNFVVMKWGVAHVPPLLLLALRFGLAAVPAIFFVARPPVAWRIIAGYGLAFGVVKFALLFFAFKFGMSAGVGSVLLQAQVFFTVAFAALISAERPTAMQVAALGLAAIGLAIIGVGNATGGAGLLPFAMVVAAAACWAVANMISKQAGRIDAFAFVVWTSAVATPPLLLLSLLFEGPGEIARALSTLTPWSIGAILYLAYPVTLLALVIWSWLLARYQAGAIAPYALLVPVFGLISAALVLGEIPNAASLLGSVTIVAALGLNQWSGRTRAGAIPAAPCPAADPKARGR